MEIFNSLWVEKYRPKNLEQIVLSESNRKIFKKFESDRTIPNLLFAGTAGIGKTSLAKIICKSILECQYLYINASDENGIDVIRTKVTNFSRTKSFDGSLKCVILDETDGLSQEAQRALRNTMEEHAELTRFILTANYKHRIIDPLQSRCQSFDLTPPVDSCVEQIKKILNTEQIEFTSNEDQLEKFVKACFPDLRKCINEIQKNVIDNKLSFDNLTRVKDQFIASIYKIVEQKLTLKARKKVIENEHVFNSDYTELLRGLFNYIYENVTNETKKANHMIIVSEHIYRSAFVVDPEINFYACLLELTNN